MGLFDLIRGMMGKRVSCAFHDYMDRHGIYYEAKSDHCTRVEFALKNRLKSATFDIMFLGESAAIACQIDPPVSKWSEVRMRILLEVRVRILLEELNVEAADGVRFKLDEETGVVSLYYNPMVDDLRCMTDEFICKFFSTPLEVLKARGDDLYDALTWGSDGSAETEESEESEESEEPDEPEESTASEAPEEPTETVDSMETEEIDEIDEVCGRASGGDDGEAAEEGAQEQPSASESPAGTTIPEAMAMVKNWLERVGFKQRTVEEGENPRIGLTVHTCAPKRIEYIVMNFFFYEFGMMVTTTVKGHAVPQEDRNRMTAALNDWNYRSMRSGNYEMSNQTGGVNFRFFVYYSDKIKLTQEMVDKVCWLANGAWAKPPEEVLKLLRVPERAGD